MQQITVVIIASLICQIFSCINVGSGTQGATANCQTACSTQPSALNVPSMTNPTYNVAMVTSSCAATNTATTGNMITATCPSSLLLQFFMPGTSTPMSLTTNMATLVCTLSGWQAAIPASMMGGMATILSPPYQLACLPCTPMCPPAMGTFVLATQPAGSVTATVTAGMENPECMAIAATSAVRDTFVATCPTDTVPVIANDVGMTTGLVAPGRLTLTCATTGWTYTAVTTTGSAPNAVLQPNKVNCLTCLTTACPNMIPMTLIPTIGGATVGATVPPATGCLGNAGVVGVTRQIICPMGQMPRIGAMAVATTLTCTATGWVAVGGNGVLFDLTTTSPLTCF